jgi:uncharacterized protein involved in type VI secretion and phage assembly
MALLGRDTKVTGPVADGALLLETFHGTEVLGSPYRYDVAVSVKDSELRYDLD